MLCSLGTAGLNNSKQQYLLYLAELYTFPTLSTLQWLSSLSINTREGKTCDQIEHPSPASLEGFPSRLAPLVSLDSLDLRFLSVSHQQIQRNYINRIGITPVEVSP